jgi:hypothetical protein
MRKSLVLAAALALVSGGAMAQTQPPASNGPQNRPVNTSDSVNRQTTMPVAGANSFTEGEAKSRIEDNGFTKVQGLHKDNNGIWRGQAMKGGRTVAVALDYQGNVVEGTGTGSSGPMTMPQGSAGR